MSRHHMCEVSSAKQDGRTSLWLSCTAPMMQSRSLVNGPDLKREGQHIKIVCTRGIQIESLPSPHPASISVNLPRVEGYGCADHVRLGSQLLPDSELKSAKMFESNSPALTRTMLLKYAKVGSMKMKHHLRRLHRNGGGNTFHT